MVARVPYDEFSYFQDNAAEFGLDWNGSPAVRREQVMLDDGRHLSAIVWGSGAPELVLIHGGAQNAHTWDTVALALDRPLVAIDMPGHGHSSAPATGATDVRGNAADIAETIRALAPDAAVVVGMSLGGLTSIALLAAAPDLVRRHVLVDITPGVDAEKAKAIASFVNGPSSFDSFDDLLARTIEHNPTRSEASLRRGILHNAVQLADGTWVWRHVRHKVFGTERRDFGALWDLLGVATVPLMLVRGMRAQSVVDDSDEKELRRRRPDARIEHIADAGHSIQGDTPIELATLLAEFISNTHQGA